MQELKNRLSDLETEFLKVYEKLNISDKLTEIAELEREVANPDIWKNVEEATAKNQQLSHLQDDYNGCHLL